MPKLTYTGPDPATIVGALPLPEGWPAADHDEPNADLAKEKVKSGNYELANGPKSRTTRPAADQAEEES